MSKCEHGMMKWECGDCRHVYQMSNSDSDVDIIRAELIDELRAKFHARSISTQGRMSYDDVRMILEES